MIKVIHMLRISFPTFGKISEPPPLVFIPLPRAPRPRADSAEQRQRGICGELPCGKDAPAHDAHVIPQGKCP